MDTTTDITKVKDLLDKARDIVIVTHEKPTHDSMGSSLALYLGLAGLGKKATVVCPDPVTVELSNYVGANKVIRELSAKNFIISLDYVDGSIEKVSYNIEGNKFNLVIEPRPGFPPFSEEKVHFSHAGNAFDLIIAVDTIHLGGLKKLYESEKDLFASKPIVNIDRHSNNSRYGQVNLLDAGASSTAELVGQALSLLGVAFTADIATNLLNALFVATNFFQADGVTAGAFELAAACVKSGGKRFQRALPPEEAVSRETVAPGAPGAEGVPHAPPVVATVQPQPQSTGVGQAPADWLKPKIFKSSNLL